MKILVLLEFGIPPYRDFLFRFLDEQEEVTELLIVHTGQKFQAFDTTYSTQLVRTIDLHHLSIHRDVLSLINRFDIIISSFNIYRPMCWLPMLWMNKKWILWGPGLGRNRIEWVNKILRKPFIKRCCKFIVYTSSAKNELVDDWAIDGSRILVANNTLHIPNAEFNPYIKRKYLLYVGRIQERKGLLKALQAIRLLKYEQGIQVPFLIVGNGDHKTKLNKYVQDHGLEDHVHFHEGTFDDALLKEYFSEALCYISPDHVGLGVVHSFSYGVPVMTFSERGHAREFQYCNDENSLLCADDQELKEKLAALYYNPSISYEKGKAGFDYYKEHLSHHRMNGVFWNAVRSCSDT